jgi:branched-chain amino acid transport system ATP-binding protein
VILRVEKVSKSFGGLRALVEVSLGVAPREVLGVIGPNGAGKTTLLNVIAGVHPPDEGAVYLDGENVTGHEPEVLCRRGLSRTFQITQSFPGLSALENVLVSAVFGNPSLPRIEAEARARRWLDFVNFQMPLSTPAANLNTTQLKRLDLARALASHPKILLLDEIAAGLTPAELKDFSRLLERIRSTGVALIVVEHLMRLIMDVCDRVVFLQSGRLIAEGPPKDLAKNHAVIEAYLGGEFVGRG